MSFQEFKGKVEFVDNPNSTQIQVGDDYTGRIAYDRGAFQKQQNGGDTVYSGSGKFDLHIGNFNVGDVPVDMRITVYGSGEREGVVEFNLSNGSMELYLILSVGAIPHSAVIDTEKVDFSVGPAQFDFNVVKGQR